MRVVTVPTRNLHLLLTEASENRSMTSPFTQTSPKESQTFKGKNRRATNRYPVRTPLQYRTSSGTLNSAWKRGRTLDMSAGGTLMEIPEAVPVGSTLELAIDWPGLYHGGPMVRLFLTGSVTRVDGRGTAFRIISHQFRDVRPAAVRPRRPERNPAVA
jgi:hypothetical protein